MERHLPREQRREPRRFLHPGIHLLLPLGWHVDGRDKPGHDAAEASVHGTPTSYADAAASDRSYDFATTSRIGRDPSQFIAACRTFSKNGPLVPLMSEISITVPGCAWVSK